MIECCEACGKKWEEHLGIMGTCKQLQAVTAERDRLREVVADIGGLLAVNRVCELNAMDRVAQLVDAALRWEG